MATPVTAAIAFALVAVASTGALESSAADHTTTHSFTAVADAYISSTEPTANFGAESALLVDSSNPNSSARRTRGYVRFEVQGLNDPATRAVVRFHSTNGDKRGFEIRDIAGSAWSEETITWENAPPAPASVVASSGSMATGEQVGLDVTSLIQGNGSVNLVLTTESMAAMVLSSREGVAPPELVVTTSASAPSNAVSPTISGNAQEGASLSADPGAWSGTTPISYSYEWQRCDAGGEDCAATGVEGAAYVLTSADVGATLRVAVTASNTAGARVAASTPTGVVAAHAVEPQPEPSTDDNPPSTPGAASVTSVTETTIEVVWEAATDNVGVTGYDLVLDGHPISTVAQPSATLRNLTCDTTYTIGVRAFDAAGNRSGLATVRGTTAPCSPSPPPREPAPPEPPVTQPGDITAPSEPSGLAVAASTQTSIALVWLPSTDDVGVEGYDVYVDGSARLSPTVPGAMIAELSCGTAYMFAVDAFDTAGNLSARASLSASTSACTDAQSPTTPSDVTAATVTTTSIALSWSASSDDVGVTGYGLYRGGSQVGTSSTTTAMFSGLACNTNYTLAIDAYDAAGNRSAKTTVMVSTSACPDTRPPSTPAGLSASSVSQTGLTLTWNASSDNVGVTGYDVYRNATKMATVTSTSSSQTGLACGTGYTFGVVSFDAAGNRSLQASLDASTSACPGLPPPPGGPGLSILDPAQGSTVSGLVTLRAQDAGSNVDWVGFYVCDGATSLEDQVRATGGVWEVIWDSTSCPNGERELGVYAFDDQGTILRSIPSWSFTVRNAAWPPPAPSPPSDCGSSSPPAPIGSRGYTLRFEDCFGSLDSETWVDHQWWEPSPPFGSIYADSGILHVVSRRADGYPDVTLSSEPHVAGTGQSFKQGYFEARIRWTGATGAGPAFWLFSTTHATNPNWPNPACGQPTCLAAEIDVFEGYGNHRDVFTGSIHRNSCNCYGVDDQMNDNNWQPLGGGDDLASDWHVYAAHWTDSTVTWYLDGVQIMSAPVYDSTDQSMHLLFYNWRTPWESGNEPDATTPDELHTEVDWVRVWQP